MIRLKLADFVVEVKNRYDYIETMCCDYITQEKPDFKVLASDEEILKEATAEINFPPYLETLAIYRKIAEKMPDFNGVLMHGVVLRVKNRGIMLCAKSGVGKTTHMLLWKKLLGEECEIINGDKPLVRLLNDRVYAFGTPWCGKEGFNKNDAAEITDICFIERSKENFVTDAPKDEVLQRIMQQIYIPSGSLEMIKTLDILDFILSKTRCRKIHCNKELEAAKVAYDAIFKA